MRGRGLWIVTETWSAPRVCVNAWQDVGREVTVGFEASFTPVGEIGPSSGWHTARNDSGWVMPKAKDVSLVRPPGLVVHSLSLRPGLSAGFQEACRLLWRPLL